MFVAEWPSLKVNQLCLEKSHFHMNKVFFVVFFFTETTEDPCHKDSVCCLRFCCKIEFADKKKLDRDCLKPDFQKNNRTVSEKMQNPLIFLQSKLTS